MRLRMFSTLFLLMDVTETARRPIVAEQGEMIESGRVGGRESGKAGERETKRDVAMNTISLLVYPLPLPRSLTLPLPRSRSQLYFDIALATPIVKTASTASAASATIRASASRSFF